ncbi:SMP-30/gluconolactonase/LRE family protein [Sphingobacterium sp. DR205]|uniref:SMP-30/gluconolactonase/LRE family protein n=1 Tax=Sphingobacterium sp. DR205 TaxID=2713573 RepID=UPI0013E471F9|nr:SMP-30/gluconolactonase/LRE family protein [Sphingobacterium sp. DR205]QIH34183.1 SMP-30/gluconolactonase/LRE family protein [Sphingobacterium sp. DR205]
MLHLINSSRYYPAFLLIILFSLRCLDVRAQLFNQDSLKLISRQFAFTEGPAVDKVGNIYFTDQPNNKIWKYNTEGHLSLFKDSAGRANGLYFNHRGQLLACADEKNEIWSISKDGKVTVLLSDVDGKKLNGPNDLWVDKKGGIYFTDPYYQRDYWTRKKPEIEAQKVYYLPSGKGKKPIVVADDVAKPNGIVGSPDGKYLYVADRVRNKTYRYTIESSGKLSGQRAVIDQGSDGMTLDNHGNIYLTGKGVSIYSPIGVLIGHIDVKEPWTSNVCFGGKDRTYLFITASTAIYCLPMRTKGVD